MSSERVDAFELVDVKFRQALRAPTAGNFFTRLCETSYDYYRKKASYSKRYARSSDVKTMESNFRFIVAAPKFRDNWFTEASNKKKKKKKKKG